MRGAGATEVAGPGRRRRALAAAAAAAASLGAAGCQVDAAVRVTETSGGSGTVAVTVLADRAADTAIGGLGAVLDTTGLAAAGWAVGPVRAVAGGGESVTATHPFATPAQATAVLAGVAGSRVAHLVLTRRAGLFSTTTTARGGLDLSCGLACFGDAGLRAATGSAVGVDPAPLGAPTTAAAARTLHLSLTVALPGAAPVTVRPALGAAAPLDVSATAVDAGTVAGAAVAAAAVVGAPVAGLLWARRRRRRARAATGAERPDTGGAVRPDGGGAGAAGAAGEAVPGGVTPAP